MWVRRSIRTVVLCLAAVAAGSGACASPTPPAITAPPAGEAEPWPEITWGTSFFARPPDRRTAERAEAVADADGVFVAVGVASAGSDDAGQVWVSSDGGAWDRVEAGDLFDGVWLIDVAAGPDGFVAIGTVTGDPFLGQRSAALVLFRSDDGRRWERVPDDPALPQGFGSGVAGGPLGYVAVGFRDPEQGALLRVSPDGRTWRTVTADESGDAATGISEPVAVDGGWLAVSGRSGELGYLHSTDGVSWTAREIEAEGTDGRAIHLVLPVDGGYVALGEAGPACGDGASCPAERVMWWSADGALWGRLPDLDPTIGTGALVSDPRRGLVSVTGVAAGASPDGWRWTSLGEVGVANLGVLDAVVRDDLIIAVGEWFEAGVESRAGFLAGGPDVEVLR